MNSRAWGRPRVTLADSELRFSDDEQQSVTPLVSRRRKVLPGFRLLRTGSDREILKFARSWGRLGPCSSLWCDHEAGECPNPDPPTPELSDEFELVSSWRSLAGVFDGVATIAGRLKSGGIGEERDVDAIVQPYLQPQRQRHGFYLVDIQGGRARMETWKFQAYLVSYVTSDLLARAGLSLHVVSQIGRGRSIRFEHRFAIYSLWGALADELADEVASTKALPKRNCDHCGRAFFPKDRRQKYCDRKDTCGPKTARRIQDKKRNKETAEIRRMFRQGKSISRISAKTGLTREQVEKRLQIRKERE